MKNKKEIEQLIQEKLEQSGPFEFEGQNCEGPCDGWDGKSRRCNCGNRRVYWELSEDKTYIYGQAY